MRRRPPPRAGRPTTAVSPLLQRARPDGYACIARRRRSVSLGGGALAAQHRLRCSTNDPSQRFTNLADEVMIHAAGTDATVDRFT